MVWAENMPLNCRMAHGTAAVWPQLMALWAPVSSWRIDEGRWRSSECRVRRSATTPSKVLPADVSFDETELAGCRPDGGKWFDTPLAGTLGDTSRWERFHLDRPRSRFSSRQFGKSWRSSKVNERPPRRRLRAVLSTGRFSALRHAVIGDKC